MKRARGASAPPSQHTLITNAIAGTAFEGLLTEVFDTHIVTALGLTGQVALARTSKAMKKYLLGTTYRPGRARIPAQWKKTLDYLSLGNHTLHIFCLIHSIMENSHGAFRCAGRNHLTLTRTNPVNVVMRRAWYYPLAFEYHGTRVEFEIMGETRDVVPSTGVRFIPWLPVPYDAEWKLTKPPDPDKLRSLFAFVRMEPGVVKVLETTTLHNASPMEYANTVTTTKKTMLSLVRELVQTKQRLMYHARFFPTPVTDDSMEHALDSLVANVAIFKSLYAQYRQESAAINSQLPRIVGGAHTAEQLTYAPPTKKRRLQ